MGGGGWETPNRTGIMYLYEKSFEVWKTNEGTLAVSSGSVAGVSRRDGGRCTKSCVERKGEKGKKSGEKQNKRDEWSASGAKQVRERGCMQLVLLERGVGPWREKGEIFIYQESVQSRRDGEKKRGRETEREGQESRHRQVREENIQNIYEI